MKMKTTDLWFASFLIFKKFKLSAYNVISRGKGEFFFQMTEEEWKKMKLEFNSSDLSVIKQTIDQLKDLCY